ncbi:serine/threonine-protein kinase [Mesorhizobium sp. M0207]|uniref:serine/threonine-protein kinase n=1 Tax=Mesorhizobium sp. M0207 TaxID=2956915 RepID=UPI00333B7085
MDLEKAQAMLATLRKSGVAGWQILEFIDHGKSAAVFKAKRGESMAAVKIFDTELITRFGDAALLERMEREKWLVGHDHPNIVKMIDSGVEPNSGNHFLIMELLDGDNLSKTLDKLPPERLPLLVEQLASAAEYLESLQLVHRDIKPANIVIADNLQRLVLLDFGVLRPVGEKGLTDNGGTPLFVGTNQYASPEFALRQEDDSPSGWQAVTFYQIGAVIHDMVMKQPLFGAHTGVPARLAQAVQNEVPAILSTDVPPYLIALAQNCLVKSPEARLQMVSWDNFKQPVERKDRALELQDRIRQRASAAQTRQSETTKYEASEYSDAKRLMHNVSEIARETLRGLGQDDPPMPRRIVYTLSEPIDGVRPDFEPLAEVGLPDGLSVCIFINVIDEKSRIVALDGGSSNCRETANWSPESKRFYIGTLDQRAIQDAISLFVFGVVDSAQQISINLEASEGLKS